MRGVGPAGRWFIWPKVRGRRMKVRMSGGRRVVYGRVERMKDYKMYTLALDSCIARSIWDAYGQLGICALTANLRLPHNRSMTRKL
jgi:hypothetical protein